MNSLEGLLSWCVQGVCRKLPSGWLATTSSYDNQSDRTVSIGKLGRAANQECFFLWKKRLKKLKIGSLKKTVRQEWCSSREGMLSYRMTAQGPNLKVKEKWPSRDSKQAILAYSVWIFHVQRSQLVHKFYEMWRDWNCAGTKMTDDKSCFSRSSRIHFSSKCTAFENIWALREPKKGKKKKR